MRLKIIPGSTDPICLMHCDGFLPHAWLVTTLCSGITHSGSFSRHVSVDAEARRYRWLGRISSAMESSWILNGNQHRLDKLKVLKKMRAIPYMCMSMHIYTGPQGAGG